jgi:[ribosomal protein S18]-alanine N-acetyltransferase
MARAPVISAESPELHFRTMSRADLTEIMEIENISFPTPWTEAMILRELETPHSIHRVAEREGRVAGYMISWLTPPEAMIMSIAVRPDWRGQGIGRGLLEDSFRTFVQTRLETVWLEVRTGNLKAQALYQKFGFREVYRRRGYYHDTGEDAIVMMKRISP